MSSICELKLPALLNRDLIKRGKTIHKNIHEQDFIIESADEVESTGMESHSIALFRLLFINLECLRHVIPDFDCLVRRARDDQLLSNAGVQASDGAAMEIADHI